MPNLNPHDPIPTTEIPSQAARFTCPFLRRLSPYGAIHHGSELVWGRTLDTVKRCNRSQ